VRNYLEQYVKQKPNHKERKFDDAADTPTTLMSSNTFRSEASAMSEYLKPEHYDLRHRHKDVVVGKGARELRRAQFLQKRLGIEASDPSVNSETYYEERKTCKASWKSTYQATLGEAAIDSVRIGVGALVVNHAKDANANKHRDSEKILRRTTALTTNQRDFGLYGSDPRQRYDWQLGTTTFSEQATCKDLFEGTAKGVREHLPNFSGHVPHAPSNSDKAGRRANNGSQQAKVNQRDIYQHELPGYTGHRPTDVINDHGSRNPATKRAFGAMRAHDIHL
jgi:hypothetical protein